MTKTTTSSAAAVIADALVRARAEGTTQIGEEHLFAALVSHPDSRRLLGGLGGAPGAEAVWEEVQRERRRGGIDAREREALADLGIDIEEVVARIEQQLRPGALDATASHRQGWRLSMSPGARTAVNAAFKQKRARGDRQFSAQHLVLGLVTTPGPFGDALRARGITATGVIETIDRNGANGRGHG